MPGLDITMNNHWQPSVILSGGLALLAGIAYCVWAVAQRRKISDQVSIQLAGALLSAMVGVQLLNVWLGVNFRTSFFLSSFAAWKHIQFDLVPFRLILYLFSALIGHYLIQATGQLIAEHRQRILIRATWVSYGMALAAIAATLWLAWVLWRTPYGNLQERYRHQAVVSQEATARYLADWLAAEPDSPYARQLHGAFMGTPAPHQPPE
jgi:hypothetical protein